MSNCSHQEVLDDHLEALGHLERRRLLLGLSTASPHSDPRIDLSEFDSSESELDPLVAMRHLHIPNLEERGFVRWDDENLMVMKGPRFDEMEPLLRQLRDIQEELPGKWV